LRFFNSAPLIVSTLRVSPVSRSTAAGLIVFLGLALRCLRDRRQRYEAEGKRKSNS
jgi:hypothetical protein